MNIAFVISIDKCAIDAFNENSTIFSLAKKYPIYLLASNIKVKDVKENQNFNFLFTRNSFSEKMILFLHHLRGTENIPDYLVRLDNDTLVLDPELLETKVKNLNKEQKIYAGNLSARVSSYCLEYYHSVGYSFNGPKYIRGACSICTQRTLFTLIDNLDSIKSSHLDRDYDYFFNCVCQEYDIKLIDYPLFELSELYEGELPCWHPLKEKSLIPKSIQISNQLRIFNENKITST